MRLVLLSDTHGLHGQVTVPDGDVLVHAGDFCNKGTIPEMNAFLWWFANQPHRHKVFIAGNHDWPLQLRAAEARTMIPPEIHYLQDRAAVVGGLRFYGMPWQPWFHDWAFNLPRDGWEMGAKVDAIPEDTQVLVTHGPPDGVLDTSRFDGVRIGCGLLTQRVAALPDLRVHVFGHNHGGYGWHDGDHHVSINASICTETYEPINRPQVIDL